MKIIPTRSGHEILVSDEDFDYLSQFSWSVTPPPSTNPRSFYARAKLRDGKGGSRAVLMHRLILADKSRRPIDHIDHNGLNNQRENLRICTVQQNNMAARRRDRDLPKGVSFCRRTGKYIAVIQVKYRKIYLGLHATQSEAAHAYNKAAVEHFGHFAVLNPI